jgi:microcystin degradation protein MlrC
VGVSERPFQVTDPDVMRHAGLTPELARVVVVKSRGHFRAGFTAGFERHEIVEVGAPGLATNDLESVAWRRLPRPVYPLDVDLEWSPRCVEVLP